MSSKEQKVAEDAPFEVPPFEEKEFIRKELISFKSTLVLFFFSIAVAGLSYAIWRTNPEFRFIVHILIALALGLGLLRFLFKATQIDMSHWKKKEWFGTTALFFFFWLGFFLLFTNPPLTDAAAPVVEFAVSPKIQVENATIDFGAYVADNTGIRSETVELCIVAYSANDAPQYASLGEAQRTDCRQSAWKKTVGNTFWSMNTSALKAGKYAAFVRAEDSSGQWTEVRETFEVGVPLIGSPPRDVTFDETTDRLEVRVRPELNTRAVQFKPAGAADWYNFDRHENDDKADQGWWQTDPSFEGWKLGSYNITIRVVEQPTYFRSAEARVQGDVWVSGEFRITVPESLQGLGVSVGDEDEPSFPEQGYAAPGQTPGFGGALALVALVGLVVLVRRHRHA